MKLKKHGSTEQLVAELAAPIAESLGLTLWDVRFEKEGAAWYLRVFIDKEEGIGIDDCEAMSRPLSDLLDEKDPISQSYYLEVGSAGLERDLIRESHFKASIGAEIRARLIRPDESGAKEYTGTLTAFDKESVTLAVSETDSVSLPLEGVAHIKWVTEFDD